MDFMRDPLWQFVGAILAVLAIIISIAIFLFQRRNKTLTYEIISRTAVLSASEEIAGKLQILFQGEAVRKVHLLVLKLANTGNVPVISSDYEREINFIFSDCEKILSAEISETNPAKLIAELIVKDKNIVLKPLLLNPGDSITLKALISGFESNIEVEGRVVGVKTIGKRTESSGWSFTIMIAGLLLFSLGLIFSLISTKSLSISENPVNLAVIIIGYLLMGIGVSSNRASRKKFVGVIKKSFP